MAIDKSSWSKTIKVSQSQIDAIKKQGMAAALKKAAAGGSASYVEGVKRLYTAKRLSDAKKTAAPAAPGGSSSYKGNAAPGGSMRVGAARTGGTMRPSGTVAKPAAKSAAKPMASKKPAPTGFASSNLAYMLGGGKKTGYSIALAKGAAAAKARPATKPAAKPAAKPVAKTAVKPAAKKPDYSNESNASYMLRSLGSGKKLGYYALMDKTKAAAAKKNK